MLRRRAVASALALALCGTVATAPTSPAAAQGPGPSAPAARDSTATLPSSAGVKTPERLDEAAVISRALFDNSTLRAALHDAQAAEAAERAAEAQYRAVFTASVGGTHSKQPISTTEGVTTTTGDNVAASVGIQRAFPRGTNLAVEADTGIDRRKAPPFAATDVPITLGPNYSAEVKGTLTQPLLRGRGLDAGEAALRSARFGREAATHARDVAASGLLRDVLVAYWELAYDTSAYEVQRQSRDLAEQQLADANERARLGLIAHADVLQFATELASLEEQVAQADSARQSQAIELGRLLGLPPAVAVQMQVRDAPARFALPDESAEGWVRRALLASDQLLQLEANAADARDQIRAAANAALAKLDLTAWVSLDGLGDKDAARPYRQIGEASALSAFVGLDLELPVVNTERRAQLAQTRATSAAADARLQASRQQVAAGVATAARNIASARARLELATRTVELAAQSADAEQGRFELGTTTPVEILQAQDALREAKLRLLRARTDLNTQAIRLADMSGALLPQYASHLPEVKP